MGLRVLRQDPTGDRTAQIGVAVRSVEARFPGEAQTIQVYCVVVVQMILSRSDEVRPEETARTHQFMLAQTQRDFLYC